MTRTAITLSALLFLASAFGLSPAIDEPTVRRILADIDRAAVARDAEGVARHMSETLVITLDIEAGGKSQRVTLTKSEYLETMKQGWAAVESYEYQRVNTKIVISGARATVTADVIETVTLQGQTVRTTTAETSVFELVGGKPLVTSMSGKTRM